MQFHLELNRGTIALKEQPVVEDDPGKCVFRDTAHPSYSQSSGLSVGDVLDILDAIVAFPHPRSLISDIVCWYDPRNALNICYSLYRANLTHDNKSLII